MNDERNKILTFTAIEWKRKSKSLYKSWMKWERIPPTGAKNIKNTELNGLGGGGEGDIGRSSFVPVGATNRDQSPYICPGWWLQPRQKTPVPPRCPG